MNLINFHSVNDLNGSKYITQKVCSTAISAENSNKEVAII